LEQIGPLKLATDPGGSRDPLTPIYVIVSGFDSVLNNARLTQRFQCLVLSAVLGGNDPSPFRIASPKLS